MSAEPSFTTWNGDAANDRLTGLWNDCAACLAELGDAIPPGTAARFQSDVVLPCNAGNFVKAVAEWSAGWTEPVPLARTIAPAELARLRSSLGDLIDKIDAPSRSSRWFVRDSDPLATPKAKALLTEIHRAFDLLARPLPANAAKVHETLAGITRAANELLALAPPTWPPAAALFVPRLVKLLADDTASDAALRPLVRRMAEFATGTDDPAGLAADVLDAFASLAVGPLGKLTRERTAWLDSVLDCIRGWFAGHDVRIMPNPWSFANPPTPDDLQGSGVTVAVVYRTEEPLGQVIRVKNFGMAHRDRVLRPAAVSVSSGVAPSGLPELEELLTETTHAAVRELADRLREWRSASLAGRLESAAVEVFVLYWDRLRGLWSAEAPDASAAFGERLAAFLIENFSLAPFYPTTFQERPAGWVQLIDGARMTTGRVREVVRPGLADRDGELRVPARVNVE